MLGFVAFCSEFLSFEEAVAEKHLSTSVALWPEVGLLLCDTMGGQLAFSGLFRCFAFFGVQAASHFCGRALQLCQELRVLLYSMPQGCVWGAVTTFSTRRRSSLCQL